MNLGILLDCGERQKAISRDDRYRERLEVEDSATMDTATRYRYVVRMEGVRGGAARIEGTRIGVHDVVAYFLLGRDVEGIQAAFPDLSRAQIFESLAYYEDHRAEIEKLALPQIEQAEK